MKLAVAFALLAIGCSMTYANPLPAKNEEKRSGSQSDQLPLAIGLVQTIVKDAQVKTDKKDTQVKADEGSQHICREILSEDKKVLEVTCHLPMNMKDKAGKTTIHFKITSKDDAEPGTAVRQTAEADADTTGVEITSGFITVFGYVTTIPGMSSRSIYFGLQLNQAMEE